MDVLMRIPMQFNLSRLAHVNGAFHCCLHSEDAVTILAGIIMQNFIASEVGVYLDIYTSYRAI